LETSEYVAISGAAPEPLGHSARPRGARDEKSNRSIVSAQLDGVAITTEGSLERAFQYRSEQPIELLSEGAAIDDEHERSSPTFEPE